MLLGAMAGGKLVEDTVTGNPVSFITDVSKPLKSLLIPFTPQQEGSGDPSPQNIRSILPWDGLTVFGGGKNLFDKAYLSDENNYAIHLGDYFYTEEITLKANTTYSLTPTSTEQLDTNRYYVLKINSFDSYSFLYPVQVGKPGNIRFTTGDKGTIQFGIYRGSLSYFMSVDWQLEVGSSASPYVPYSPITETDISFPSPCYGGTLDAVSGVLTVEWVGKSSTWGEIEKSNPNPDTGYQRSQLVFDDALVIAGQGASAQNSFCNVGKYDWNTTSVGVPHFYPGALGGVPSVLVFQHKDTPSETPIQAVCKLAEPYTVQLTPEQITAIKGQNTLWSDADGDMTAVYLKKG